MRHLARPLRYVWGTIIVGIVLNVIASHVYADEASIAHVLKAWSSVTIALFVIVVVVTIGALLDQRRHERLLTSGDNSVRRSGKANVPERRIDPPILDIPIGGIVSGDGVGVAWALGAAGYPSWRSVSRARKVAYNHERRIVELEHASGRYEIRDFVQDTTGTEFVWKRVADDPPLLSVPLDGVVPAAEYERQVRALQTDGYPAWTLAEEVQIVAIPLRNRLTLVHVDGRTEVREFVQDMTGRNAGVVGVYVWRRIR